jgi:hypothetical protein
MTSMTMKITKKEPRVKMTMILKPYRTQFVYYYTLSCCTYYTLACCIGSCSWSDGFVVVSLIVLAFLFDVISIVCILCFGLLLDILSVVLVSVVFIVWGSGLLDVFCSSVL